MEKAVLLVSIIIIIRILLNDFLEKIPVPSLIIFILLGMCFGENGLFKINFDNYSFVNIICSVSLIFIMFYGGFGTNLKAAKPVVAQSVLLSTVGVAGTAGAVGLFSHFILHLPWLESILIGSVISSTDAASVFNILRSRNGVAGTAGAVGLFSHFILHLPWLESILIGSVISSTDAASVFNILRSRNLAKWKWIFKCLFMWNNFR